MSRRLVCVAFVWVGGLASGASAAPVTAYFTGTITSIDDPHNVFSAYQLGNPVRGSYSYDSGIPDTDPNPGHGLFLKSQLSTSTFTFEVGGATAIHGPDLQLETYNDWPTVNDLFSIGGSFPPPPPCVGGVTILTFKDTTQTAQSSDALPTGPPILSRYNIHDGFHAVICDSPPTESRLSFEITSTSATPVPTVNTWGLVALASLLVLGGGGILNRRRAAIAHVPNVPPLAFR